MSQEFKPLGQDLSRQYLFVQLPLLVEPIEGGLSDIYVVISVKLQRLLSLGRSEKILCQPMQLLFRLHLYNRVIGWSPVDFRIFQHQANEDGSQECQDAGPVPNLLPVDAAIPGSAPMYQLVPEYV